MIRKVWLGISVLAILAPGAANALGVGNYRLNSYLDQPLDMDIPLTGIGDLAAGDIVVSLADQKAFDAAGIKRTAVLSSLSFSVTLNKKGGGDVHITTKGSVSMPYLDFLVQVLWPTGRVVREYTLLLDPASYAQALTPVAVTSPTTAHTSSIRPVSAASQGDSRSNVGSIAASPAPSGAARTYKVQEGDSLWSIASRLRRDSNVSVQQMVIAIEQANPDAFTVSGNANSVRSGALLHIPDVGTVAGIEARAAMQRLAQQNQRWQQLHTPQPIATGEQINAGSQQVVRNSASVNGPVKGQVQLLTSADSDAATSVAEASANRPTADKSSAPKENAGDQASLIAERLDLLSQKNQELSSRLDELQQQVATSDKLLELRSARIALMQKELRKLKQQGADIAPALLKSISDANSDVADTTTGTAAEQPASGTAAPDADVVADTSASTASDAAIAVPITQASTAAKGTTDAKTNANTKTNADTARADVENTVTKATGQQVSGDHTAAVAPVATSSKPIAVAADKAVADQSVAKQPASKPSTSTSSSQPDTATTPAQSQAGIIARVIDFVRHNLLVAGLVIVLLLLMLLALVKRSRDRSEPTEEVNFVETDLTPEGQQDLAETAAVTSVMENDTALVKAADDALDTADDNAREDVSDDVSNDASNDVTPSNGIDVATSVAITASDSTHQTADNDADNVTMENWGAQQAEDDLLPENSDLDFSFDDAELSLNDTSTRDGHVGFETLDVDAHKPLELGAESDLLEFETQSGDVDSLEVAAPDAEGAAKDAIDESEYVFDFEEFDLVEEIDVAATSKDDGIDDPADILSDADQDVAAVTEDTDLEFSYDNWQLDAAAADAADVAVDINAAGFDKSLEDVVLSTAETETAASEQAALDTPVRDESGDASGWDDDGLSLFDSGDENATRLDLARAFIDMGDQEGASDLLAEVMQDGNSQQQSEAQELINQIG